MKKTKAFSLIEMLCVLAILGTIVSLGVPAYIGLISSLELKGNARRIVSMLRLYHQKAIIDHINYSIEFYTSDDSYKINGFAPLDYWEISEGIDIKNNLLVTFQPLGNANPTGSVTIENEKGSLTIEIKSTTGHVRIIP